MAFETPMSIAAADSSPPASPAPRSPLTRIAIAAALAAGLTIGSLLVDTTAPPSTLTGDVDIRDGPPPALSVPLVGLGDNLVIGYVCLPTVAGGSGELAVSFEVTNAGPRDILVTDLPAGPPPQGLAGLQAVGVTGGGECGRPGFDTPGGLVQAAQRRLFTFWYRPSPCPRPTRAHVPVVVHQ